jgi:hypothetical protein
LAKLFYLSDLSYEIEERSTAIEHTSLAHAIWLAIGDTARREGRARVETKSSPTESFSELWHRHGIEVKGVHDNSSTVQLAIPESQTRVVAWRLSRTVSSEALLQMGYTLSTSPHWLIPAW